MESSTDSTPPEELTQIYLSHLYNHLKYILEQKLSSTVVRNTAIDFVLTVPAIWRYSAMQKIKTIAQNAGFMGSQPIQLVSEPVSLAAI